MNTPRENLMTGDRDPQARSGDGLVALDSHLKPYVAGKSIREIAELSGKPESEIVKLGSNENPLGIPTKAEAALLEAVNHQERPEYKLNYYADSLSETLVAALESQHPELEEAARVVAGNGLDNIIETVSRLCLRPGDATLIPTPTFSYYEITTRWAGATPEFLPMSASEEFAFPLQQFLAALESGRYRLAFLCSPNNPTGTVIPRSAIEAVTAKAQAQNCLVFLDEAYAEYQGESCLDMVRHYPNLIVGRTFSKIYGLAAMRLGWAAIHKELLPHYRKVQTPFNTNLLALLAGKAALNDAKFLEESLRVNREGLDHLRRAFSRLNVRSFPTAGNFLAFEAPGGMSAKEFCDKLLTHGIILRDASRFRGAPDNLVRVTVGTQIENNKVLAALEEILQD